MFTIGRALTADVISNRNRSLVIGRSAKGRSPPWIHYLSPQTLPLSFSSRHWQTILYSYILVSNDIGSWWSAKGRSHLGFIISLCTNHVITTLWVLWHIITEVNTDAGSLAVLDSYAVMLLCCNVDGCVDVSMC